MALYQSNIERKQSFETDIAVRTLTVDVSLHGSWGMEFSSRWTVDADSSPTAYCSLLYVRSVSIAIQSVSYGASYWIPFPLLHYSLESNEENFYESCQVMELNIHIVSSQLCDLNIVTNSCTSVVLLERSPLFDDFGHKTQHFLFLQWSARLDTSSPPNVGNEESSHSHEAMLDL